MNLRTIKNTKRKQNVKERIKLVTALASQPKNQADEKFMKEFDKLKLTIKHKRNNNLYNAAFMLIPSLLTLALTGYCVDSYLNKETIEATYYGFATILSLEFGVYTTGYLGLDVKQTSKFSKKVVENQLKVVEDYNKKGTEKNL